jgi:hypothetical protein
MPESVRDRPTTAHEYVFLLAQSARYFYDAEAVRETSSPSSVARVRYSNGKPSPKYLAFRSAMSTAKAYGQGRNLRSVWTIATEPYPGAHFATFPTKLVEPCIKAGIITVRQNTSTTREMS